MKKSEIKQLVRECITEVITDQLFDTLRDNVSSRTAVGENWKKLLYSLESLYEEAKEFEASYGISSSAVGKPANIPDAVKKIEQIVALAQSMKQSIIGMDRVQRYDMGI